jgi:L-ascorbate metabolism protein UlaG (beta-lactamase superfamily)
VIEPALKDEAFLADVKAAAAQAGRLHLWWLGQSGFLIAWDGRFLLMDPYLSDSLTEKYAGTDRPHVRMTARVVDPSRLDFIDCATSSHNHTDHLDGETLKPLLAANPGLSLLVSEANRLFAADRLGVPPERLTGLLPGEPVTIGPFTFHALPSAHESLEFDDLGRPKYIGIVVQAGPWTLYHSGDAVPYPGLGEALRQWAIDIALLPVNGRDPQRGVAGNFSALEAARLGREIGARWVVPCHYQMFEFNSVSPDAFVQAAEAVGQPYRVLQNGERWSVEA